MSTDYEALRRDLPLERGAVFVDHWWDRNAWKYDTDKVAAARLRAAWRILGRTFTNALQGIGALFGGPR